MYSICCEVSLQKQEAWQSSSGQCQASSSPLCDAHVGQKMTMLVKGYHADHSACNMKQECATALDRHRCTQFWLLDTTQLCHVCSYTKVIFACIMQHIIAWPWIMTKAHKAAHLKAGTLVSCKGPRNISYRRKESAPYLYTTSSGLMTLPRLLLILCFCAVTSASGCCDHINLSPFFSTSAESSLHSHPSCLTSLLM